VTVLFGSRCFCNLGVRIITFKVVVLFMYGKMLSHTEKEKVATILQSKYVEANLP